MLQNQTNYELKKLSSCRAVKWFTQCPIMGTLLHTIFAMGHVHIETLTLRQYIVLQTQHVRYHRSRTWGPGKTLYAHTRMLTQRTQ